jgi:hypothetical protein
MTITTRQSTVTRSETRAARIWDGHTEGLQIAHLKAFLVEAEKAGLDDDTRVKIDDKLSSGSPHHVVEISASVTEPVFIEIGDAEEEEAAA